jgi:hypothetical protein
MDEHDRRKKRVKDATANDPSGFTATILCVAYAEYYLRRILASMMLRPKSFFTYKLDSDKDAAVEAFLSNKPPPPAKKQSKNDERTLDFGLLVRLADAMAIIEPFDSAMLLALGQLRNLFAHDIDYVLDLKDIVKMRAVLYKDLEGNDAISLPVRDSIKKHFDNMTQGEHLPLFISDVIDRLDLKHAELIDSERLALLTERAGTWDDAEQNA